MVRFRVLARAVSLKTDFRSIDAEAIPHAVKGALGFRWQLGIRVLFASDENWEMVVSGLLRTSSRVLVDLTAPSDCLMKEVALLATNMPAERIIWLHSASTPIAVVLRDGEYEIFGHVLRGPFKQFVYPDTSYGNLSNRDVAGDFDDLNLLAGADKINRILV